MNAFCKIRGLERESVCFMHNGREVVVTDTPNSIGLKEGDNIDVYDRYIQIYYFVLNGFQVNILLNISVLLMDTLWCTLHRTESLC